MSESIFEKIAKHNKDGIYPMHMPGHKRNLSFAYNMYDIDITEIEGFDDLHDAEGIIEESQKKAADLFKAKECKFLVNGSTVGILSAILGCTEKGDIIIMGRNSHKSVYNALYLNELCGKYLIPDYIMGTSIFGNLSLKKVEELINKNKSAKAIVITSPSYEGVVQDIKGIVELAHKNNILVIVDEAHGSHMSFHESLPTSAVEAGADFVIQSTHKTLPMLTQTALLHININRERDEYKKVINYLKIFQTSSPSYLLMGSIDYGIEYLVKNGKEIWNNYIENLRLFRGSLKGLSSLKLLDEERIAESGVYGFDIGKISIMVPYRECSGTMISTILRDKYNIQMEMSQKEYILAMTSVMDTKEGFNRFYKALMDIDQSLHEKYTDVNMKSNFLIKDTMTIAEAARMKGKRVRIEESCNCISKEFVYIYPPGIPFLVPGEIITEEAIERIRDSKINGLKIQGLSDREINTIMVTE